MDIGPSSQRRPTRRRRVSSPNAAKSDAQSLGGTSAGELRRMDDVLLNYLHHDAPTALVRAECLRATRQRDAIETGLGDGQHDAVADLLPAATTHRPGHPR